MNRVLVANRAEIAVRVIRTCRALGVETVAVYAPPDARAMHVALADGSVELAGAPATAGYLDGDALLRAAEETGADAVHPGYGFLSENAEFAERVLAAGLTWVGPSPEAIRAMGDKVAARAVATRAGVATIPGSPDPIAAADAVVDFGAEHGWPLLIKAAAGGGGRGMRIVTRAQDADDAVAAARREALAGFGDDRLYVERYLPWPRHVEVQVLCDAHGTALALGDRDCSVQRRHQKLVEEAPAPSLAPAVRSGLREASLAICDEIGYRGAGTLEFLVEQDAFFFLEMNTRLQVEHPVTEAIYGIDLVEAQLRIAAGEPIGDEVSDAVPRGHAIECRINAEDPAGGRFLPSPGRITRLDPALGPGVRLDLGYRAGDEVPPHYDNLVGKLVVHGIDREHARRRLITAIDELVIEGIATSLPAQRLVLAHDDFVGVRHATAWLEREVAIPETPAPAPLAEDEPHEREVWVNERRYVLEPPLSTAPAPASGVRATSQAPASRGAGRKPRRPGSATGSGALLAPMQGTVVSVAVDVGARVAEGQLLCVLEAMKMENELVATHPGTVSELRVAPGQSVAAGDLLVVVEPEAER